ncbi:MAG: tetratricopeptide repeat protein [Thermodesulfobacteriota bacterium]
MRNNMSRPYQTLAACFFLAVIVTVLFYPVTGHEFLNMDDPFFVQEHHVPGGLTPANIKRAFTLHYGMWMPLTWLSHMVDAQLYGLKPAGHHLTSLIIHLANTLLLFLALRSMTGAFYRSLIIAAIFGVHPLQVEPAAYIACRKDLLAAFFWVLTILGYTRYVHRPSRCRYLAVCLCFFLGLMAKPVLVTLPLILLLLDYWPLYRFNKGKTAALIMEKLPLLAGSILIGLVTVFTQEQAGAMTSLSDIPLSSRIANALVNYAAYLGHIFWPTDMAIFYPWQQQLPGWKYVGAALLLLTITVGLVSRREESPYLLTGWFWFLIALLPVIGIIPVGSHGMADRYAYIPGIGVLIAAVWTAGDITRQWRIKTPFIIICLSALFLVLGIISRHQIGYWKNSETVFRHALDVTTGNYAAHNNLARTLMEKRIFDEARDHLNRAIMIHPDFPQAHNNMGVLLAAEKQGRKALGHFARAIDLYPGFTEAHYNMANELMAGGAHTLALNHYRQALRIRPDYQNAADIHYRIGLIMTQRRKTDKAAASLRQALSLDPGHIEATNALAAIFKAGRHYDQAIGLYQQLLEKRPDCSISIAYNLACLYSLKSDPDTAVAWLKKSIEAGFSHCEWLEADSELDHIRHTKDFQDLMKQFRPAK